MAAGTTYFVEMTVVITNQSTKDKLERAIAQLEELAEDYPWLDLADPVRDLNEAFKELAHEPTG